MGAIARATRFEAISGLISNGLWWYGAYVAKLTSSELSAAQRRAHTLAWAPGPLVAAILTVVAFANPTLAVSGFVVIVLVYLLPIPKLLALRRERSGHSPR
jgi:uncharacterized membrane protein YdcZ (DUF606 family)